MHRGWSCDETPLYVIFVPKWSSIFVFKSFKTNKIIFFYLKLKTFKTKTLANQHKCN